MSGFFLVNLILIGIFLIQFLITADQTRNLVVSIVACAFESLILPDELSNMRITFVNLHFQRIDILSELGNGPSINVSLRP